MNTASTLVVRTNAGLTSGRKVSRLLPRALIPLVALTAAAPVSRVVEAHSRESHAVELPLTTPSVIQLVSRSRWKVTLKPLP